MTREHVQTKLADFIRIKLLKDPTYPLAEDEPLISGGIITSFFMVQLAMFIEEEFGVHVSDAELTVEHLDTLRQMTDLIMKAY